jgi:hypothetical protein
MASEILNWTVIKYFIITTILVINFNIKYTLFFVLLLYTYVQAPRFKSGKQTEVTVEEVNEEDVWT